MVRSSEELLDLPPADVERRIAGARRRLERHRDDLVVLLLAVTGPHMKHPMTAADLIGRPLGESQVPGYAKEPTRGR